MADTTDMFATPADMADRSGGTIAAEHPFLERELRAATRSIRNHCGWHIAGKHIIKHRRRGRFSAEVWLPAMRIESIESGTIDGAAINPALVDFDEDTGWTPLVGRAVDVTFVAGFDPIPEDLVTLTLELAAGALGSPLGISREQAGGVSVTFTRTSGALLIGPGGPDEARLAPYRLGVLP
ncbi:MULTISPECIES: hypothetical protein [unclassified Leucobacter]|uniref:hypothetical protein n=1 Tax=unclassified Leucobacter TaxID=2621730 RepID=UPI00069B016D|nr:hypothetical protein [Leucobacter sp. Ag1]